MKPPARCSTTGAGICDYVKPRFRGWLHLIWFEVSLVAGTLLIVATHGARGRTAVTIFAVAVAGLFGVSALYHRGNWSARASRVLQRADTTMIYLLIACTAMPAFLLAMPFRYGVACLAVLGGLTLVAILVRLAWMNAPERLVGATFLGLGCVAGIAIPALWIRAGVAAGALAIAGGGLYAAGALSYHRRRPDPLPSVFGYHEVFHAYVCAAATCQFVAVYLLATH